MRTISIITPYFENPKMFELQCRMWGQLPKELLAKTEFIVIDDCSTEFPASNYAMIFPGMQFRLYRVTEKAKWNWIACRNIGAHEAHGDWLMMTDMDHVVDAELLAHLHSMKVEPDCFYVPSRVDGPARVPNPKPHPNSYFMSRDFFWKVGGYDENYSGNYGTDGIWRRRCEALGKRVLLDMPLVQYLPDHGIQDCRSTLDRKSEEQRAAVLKITEQGLPVKTLSFPYERII